jgi:hypothetical protein
MMINYVARKFFIIIRWTCVDVEDADDAEEDVTGPPPAVDGS